MIVGLVAITPAPVSSTAGARSYHAASSPRSIVYLALNYLSRARPFRNVDDTLGVVYTHGFAGVARRPPGRHLRQPAMAGEPLCRTDLRRRAAPARVAGADTAAWVIVFSAIGTFILLNFGRPVPLRMSDEDMEDGDIAVHGHEVYPSDVPSLGYPSGPGRRRHRPPADPLGRSSGSAVSRITATPTTGPPCSLLGGGLSRSWRAATSGALMRTIPLAARRPSSPPRASRRRGGLLPAPLASASRVQARMPMSARLRASWGINATPTPAATGPGRSGSRRSRRRRSARPHVWQDRTTWRA